MLNYIQKKNRFVDEKIYEKSYTDISIYVSELMKTCKGISDK